MATYNHDDFIYSELRPVAGDHADDYDLAGVFDDLREDGIITFDGTGYAWATDEDGDPVGIDVESYFEPRDVSEWRKHGEGWYRLGWSDGGASGDSAWYDNVDDYSSDLHAAYGRATETHLPYLQWMGDGEEPVETYFEQ